MKRIFCLIQILILTFAVISCSEKKKDEIPGFEEQVSKEIVAEAGGKIESSDGKISIDIPAGALEEDTTITMTIYDASSYTSITDKIEGKKLVSKVVEFEPSGTIFKKPVLISMVAEEAFENKIVSAAVYYESEGRLSYSEHGAYGVMGQNEAGDPIMTTAAGDPIMLSDGNMTTGAGDPIMNSAAGDPIMLAAAGDPIMTSAAGDPIMSAAAGDPIMMGAGHFTAYAFIALDPTEPEEESEDPENDEDVSDEDPEPATDEDEGEDEDEDEDEDVVPEPSKVYSKVVCTGQRTCSSAKSEFLATCPKEDDELYGQDANYITRKSCKPRDFEKLSAEMLPDTEVSDDDPPQGVKDNNTGLTWIYTPHYGAWTDAVPSSGTTTVTLSEFCDSLEYKGYDDWRVPTPKEFLSIADADIITDYVAINAFYFRDVALHQGESFWTTLEGYNFNSGNGSIEKSEDGAPHRLMCVRGEEFGKVNAENYVVVPNEGDEMIHDTTTDLFWQKNSVSNHTWKEALKYCENLEYAGYTDWRLPNKNELATLVDYSKSNPASSFPGMTSEIFAISTRYQTVDDFEPRSNLWGVNMAEGTFDLFFLEEEYTQDTPPEPTFSVRCVRSDLDEFPEDGIPECDPKIGYAPCKDAVSGIIWSSRLFPFIDYSWRDAAQECRNLDLDGHKWRLPTIDELRTLVVDNEFIKPGGTCNVSPECYNGEDEECYTDASCIDENGSGFESQLLDYGNLVSGSAGFINESFDLVWMISTTSGNVSIFPSYDGIFFDTVIRCVRDETLPDLTTPYEVESAEFDNFFWSSVGGPFQNITDAQSYCENLDEGGYMWRLPSEFQIEQLLKGEGCMDDSCLPYTDGRYSLFGDAAIFWTNVDTAIILYDFNIGRIVEMTGGVNSAYVRCVRFVPQN